ncbi:MAG: ABC transporter ATP-binding protein [Planctomycetota bacterium]
MSTIPQKIGESESNTYPRVSLRGISKAFDGIPVIQDLSFEVSQGEILALLGPSGCGKTTTLRLTAGFERPDRGEISIQGRLVASPDFTLPPEQRSMGMVFQDYALFPHMTVAANIVYGLRDLEQWRQERVLTGMLELVGMEGYGGYYPYQLSGGQQQRVAVARALAPCPAALLLDEPFSNLDADMRSQMRLEVLSILRQAMTTAILVTHDQGEAFTLADRVGVLNQGRLEQLDIPEAIYHRPQTAFVARFVGQADFLRAEVKQGHVVTELGSFTTNEPLPGTRLNVMIRPDDIDFIPDDQAKTVIVGREFRGSENIYSIRLESGQVIRSSQPSTAIYPLKQSVQVRANLDHVVIFPADEVDEPG